MELKDQEECNFSSKYLSTSKQMITLKKKVVKVKNKSWNGSLHGMYSISLLLLPKQKQPRFPSTMEWLNKVWHMQTMGCYSVLK